MTKKTHLQHIRRFVKFAREHDTSIFEDHVLFRETQSGALRQPEEFFLDKPFAKTGLGAWYEGTGTKTPLKSSLWSGYNAIKDFTEFARKIGVVDCLTVEQVPIFDNPRAAELHKGVYIRKAERGAGRGVVDEDYTIPDADRVLKRKNADLSRLVWNTMCTADEKYLMARYARSKKRTATVREANSQIVHILRTRNWIPDKAGRFHKPESITAENLARGFHFNNDNGWLTAIGFGEAAQGRTAAGLKRKEAADELRITPPMMKLVDLLKGVPDDERDGLIEECTRLAKKTRNRGAERSPCPGDLDGNHKEGRAKPTTSTREFDDRARRDAKIGEEVRVAPEVTRKPRERLVCIPHPGLRSEIREYLRDINTNEDQELVCQLCHEVMPFKVGSDYYFEAVECVWGLPKKLKYNHLALCANCAAKYLWANAHKAEEIHSFILDAPGLDVPVTLAEGPGHKIHFTQKHLEDLRVVLGCLQSSRPCHEETL